MNIKHQILLQTKLLMIGKSSIVFINEFLAALSIAQQAPHKVCKRPNHKHLPQLLKLLKELHVISGYHLSKTIAVLPEVHNVYPYDNNQIRPNPRTPQSKTCVSVSRHPKASYPFVSSRSTRSKPRIVSCKKLKE